MSNIAPNSTIKILKNVPLDNTYKHTIYFASRTSQSSTLGGYAKYTENAYTYQRVNKNTCRVAHKADNLYDCNYMMFQNTAYGTKWFYAFITNVEFVNNEVSDITFEIDVMQTWLVGTNLDYQLGKQYVEREHADSDSVGGNIVPEPVELGEYVYEAYETLYNLSNCNVILGVTENFPDQQFPEIGYMYDNLYSGCRLYHYTLDTDGYMALGTKLAQWLDPNTGEIDKVKFAYVAPNILFNAVSQGVIPWGKISLSPNANGTGVTGEEFFNDSASQNAYQPKNKKLYTYPYNCYCVDNSCGDTMVLRYEFFNNHTPNFTLKGTFIQPVSVSCFPSNYKNITTNFKECVTVNNFPQCSWSEDYFARWLAQDGVSSALSALGSVGLAGAVGGVGGAAMALATNAIGLGATAYKASMHADIAKGKTSSNVLLSSSNLRIRGCRMHITTDMCRSIDNFFTRFGYAMNRIKEPNITSRPHWNYLKTVDCTIKGSVPANDMKKINEIYDSGITFWKNASEVGNYLLNNALSE